VVVVVDDVVVAAVVGVAATVVVGKIKREARYPFVMATISLYPKPALAQPLPTR
jgi:hypothetical protein